jgi:ADP-ribosylglycohydrolase
MSNQPSAVPLPDRIAGCLLGAAIGAELGYAKAAHPERYQFKSSADILGFVPQRATRAAGDEKRIYTASLTPFIGLGVRAYLAQGGRATPEVFAACLKDDAQIAAGVFSWDGVHTTQEVLKEGMNPRLGGLLNAPCGLIAAAMPAVGIYHFADPEYAYLDGVELASVSQPREGADWAALCAAGIAAAFDPAASEETIIETVLKISHRHCKDVFYQINHLLRMPMRRGQVDEAAFAELWMAGGGRGDGHNDTNWIAHNPMMYVLPLFRVYGGNAVRFMALMTAATPFSWYDAGTGGHPVPAIVGGAMIGAMHGPQAFPAEWLAWAELIVAPWLAIEQIVSRRLAAEQAIIADTEKLRAAPSGEISRLEDKVYGCLLAGAIGNAMGSVVEGKHYWEIDEQHPGGIQTVLDPARLEGEDDNQMAMLLVETYMARDGLPVMARHFGETWRERLNRDHFYALCMGHAYDLIREGWDPRITGHWSVVTGSTVMCMEPVGIYHTCDPDYASIDAMAISYMYQRGADNLAATMLAATVAEAFRSDATVASVLEAALIAAGDTPLRSFDARLFKTAGEYIRFVLDVADKYDDVLAARPELYAKCLFYHMIDPLELWALSLAMFKIAQGDVRQAAIGGTNIGRDSDTIAGRAAMLSGALKGSAGVPREWMALFKPESLARIRANAGRLAELAGVKRLARMKKRQAVARTADRDRA